MSAAQPDDLEITAIAYHDLLEPALFRPLAKVIAGIACLESKNRVLDIGCGTGALTQELSDRMDDGAKITALDANPGMLAVARRRLPGVEFEEGNAEALPFADEAFDAIVSQFALMLFDDRVRSLREMWRVLSQGGTLTVAVFDGLSNNEAYKAIADVYERHVGTAIAAALRFPFSMGDVTELRSLFDEARIRPIEVRTVHTTARFESALHLARADIEGWFPFAGLQVSNRSKTAIAEELENVFDTSKKNDKGITFDVHAHIMSAAKS